MTTGALLLLVLLSCHTRLVDRDVDVRIVEAQSLVTFVKETFRRILEKKKQ